MTLPHPHPGTIECERIAYLHWVYIPDVGIRDFGHPEVHPCKPPFKHEWCWPAFIDKRTHRPLVADTPVSPP